MLAVRNVIAFRNTVLFNTTMAVDLDKISEEGKKSLTSQCYGHSVMARHGVAYLAILDEKYF